MKNSVLFLVIFIFFFGLMIQPGCKTKDDSVDQYTLTVTVGTGVTGTPITGTHTYEKNQTVSYSYTLQTGYSGLTVTLDGSVIANSGTITMNSNHTLSATAEYTLTVLVGTGVTGTPITGIYPYKENEIVSYSYTLEIGYENLEVMLDGITIADSGTITMNSNHTLESISDELIDPSDDWEGMLYNGTDYTLWVTFWQGDYYSGKTIGRLGDSGYGYGGYTISGDQISFDLRWGNAVFQFEGTINYFNMSGSWSNNSGADGTWDLRRQ